MCLLERKIGFYQEWNAHVNPPDGPVNKYQDKKIYYMVAVILQTFVKTPQTKSRFQIAQNGNIKDR